MTVGLLYFTKPFMVGGLNMQLISYVHVKYCSEYIPHCSNKNRSLTHWGRVTHKCVGNLTIIGSDNGLSPGRRQAIIWTNAVILLIRILGTNFSKIPGETHSFSYSEMHLKMSSAKWRLFGLDLNVLSLNKNLTMDTWPHNAQSLNDTPQIWDIRE